MYIRINNLCLLILLFLVTNVKAQLSKVFVNDNNRSIRSFVIENDTILTVKTGEKGIYKNNKILIKNRFNLLKLIDQVKFKNDKFYAVSTFEGNIEIWINNNNDIKQYFQYKGNKVDINQLTFYDTNLLYCTDDGYVNNIALPTKKTTFLKVNKSKVISFLKKADLLYTISIDGTISIIDLQTFDIIDQFSFKEHFTDFCIYNHDLIISTFDGKLFRFCLKSFSLDEIYNSSEIITCLNIHESKLFFGCFSGKIYISEFSNNKVSKIKVIDINSVPVKFSKKENNLFISSNKGEIFKCSVD
ncbi:hypothetical protein EI427_15450 [Flammeovirga pectinis]|uniref:WD40 repeat domain-containing protein n=1 Tax=Flammeovirga pectinis TaxID=2494373 RepID=A0A3Q9FMI7_9BACT|nr:hypothetical protein [Flammeovirga pectinis]AZQ63566.1 hypothetical protein EI427_15450 [Flammeovirga pectinis]